MAIGRKLYLHQTILQCLTWFIMLFLVFTLLLSSISLIIYSVMLTLQQLGIIAGMSLTFSLGFMVGKFIAYDNTTTYHMMDYIDTLPTDEFTTSKVEE